MGTERSYQTLPFYWHRDTLENDRRWLESIVRNTAPFSDAWTKARIVQLGYPYPPNTKPGTVEGLPTYGGYTSEAEIASVLRSSCNLLEYPGFETQVNEDYVIRTLNSWHNREFTQAISRNFEVYADRYHSNIFLVVSTAPSSLNVDRQLPSRDRFRPLFNIAELGQMMRLANFNRITLRTHGYATPPERFYPAFVNEAESLSLKGPINQVGTLEEKSVYIGYHWPGERPILSPGLWTDPFRYWGISLKFLVGLALAAFGGGSVLYFVLGLLIAPLLTIWGIKPIVDSLWQWITWDTLAGLISQWLWVAFSVFLLWLFLFQLLRIVVYQRDRYRIIHYGAPDLAEFFWRLDKALGDNPYASMPFLPGEQPRLSPLPTLNVNLIGHSMGCLLVVNVLRILSDRFGKEDRLVQQGNDMGEYLRLDRLILSAPDIPLEFLREGRNNYVRSAILRCREIYLFSSDRDLVLRYLSVLGNWFSEPSVAMSGLRLGNVYLKTVKTHDDQEEYRPFIRIMVNSQAAVEPTSAYDLFEKFNYFDCSQMSKINGVKWKLNAGTALPIDLVNALLYFANKIDVHGAYYWVDTPSFEIIQFLITRYELSRSDTLATIYQLIENTPIRFRPSQPFSKPNV
ncbi:alpha/beta hydrolase [Limnospira fusiformis]|uniref:alpha/beta hydrolase n=1 Tax=Limnospira fusiformis TaxID=54297 RepID=UPI002AA1F890|nr:alpha/beta hydrolase [Limnospira fusiformis LS22]